MVPQLGNWAKYFRVPWDQGHGLSEAGVEFPDTQPPPGSLPRAGVSVWLLAGGRCAETCCELLCKFCVTPAGHAERWKRSDRRWEYNYTTTLMSKTPRGGS